MMDLSKGPAKVLNAVQKAAPLAALTFGLADPLNLEGGEIKNHLDQSTWGAPFDQMFYSDPTNATSLAQSAFVGSQVEGNGEKLSAVTALFASGDTGFNFNVGFSNFTYSVFAGPVSSFNSRHADFTNHIIATFSAPSSSEEVGTKAGLNWHKMRFDVGAENFELKTGTNYIIAIIGKSPDITPKPILVGMLAERGGVGQAPDYICRPDLTSPGLLDTVLRYPFSAYSIETIENTPLPTNVSLSITNDGNGNVTVSWPVLPEQFKQTLLRASAVTGPHSPVADTSNVGQTSVTLPASEAGFLQLKIERR